MTNESPDPRCPTCGRTMAPERHDRIEVDRCAGCGAIWFDRTELAAYVAAKSSGTAVIHWGERIEEPDPSTPLPECPRCRSRTLRLYELLGFRFRRCGGCWGVHMGGAELDELIQRRDEEELDRAVIEALGWLLILLG